MAFIDPTTKFPRTWREQSLEFKCMFAYHVVMMAMFATGVVPIVFEFAVAGGLVAVFAFVSMVRRRKLGWRRPPLTTLDGLKAGGVAVAIGLFLFVASQNAPVLNPHFLPWMLAGAGIGLFGVLQQLKLVAMSEEQFLEMGRPSPAAGHASPSFLEPRWHRVVRGLYGILFMSMWLAFLAFFYLHGVTLQNASPVPTAAQSVALIEHGATFYVAADRARLLGAFENGAMIGIPALLFGGFFLHFVAGVRIFGDVRAPWRR